MGDPFEVALRVPLDTPLGGRLSEAEGAADAFDALDASMHPYGREHWAVYSLSEGEERVHLVLRPRSTAGEDGGRPAGCGVSVEGGGDG